MNDGRKSHLGLRDAEFERSDVITSGKCERRYRAANVCRGMAVCNEVNCSGAVDRLQQVVAGPCNVGVTGESLHLHMHWWHCWTWK